MGFFSNASSAFKKEADSLPAFAPPLGLDPTLVSDRQTVLSIKPAKSGIDWTVVDQDGQAVVLYKGVDKSRQLLHPRTGELIFHLPHVKNFGTQWVYDSALQEVVSLSEDKTVLKSVIVVRFDDPKTEVPVELHLRLGKMVERGVLRQELVHGERVVAWIINKTSGLTKTAYAMTVAPGVDLALMTAICLYYDLVVKSRRMDVAGVAAGSTIATGGGSGGGGGS